MKLIIKGFVTVVGGVLVFLGLGLVFGASQWDVWARKGLERQMGRILEAPVTVGHIVVHPLARTLEITDLAVSNPRSFIVGPAIEIPRVSVAVDPSTLFGRRVVFPSIRAEKTRIHLRYIPGEGSNIHILTERARLWRESSHLGWHPPGYRVGLLTSSDAELTTYALGRSVTVPLADIALKDVSSEEVSSTGGMAAAVLRRALDEMVSPDTVLEGLGERLGDEFRKWMGETPI